MSGIILHLFSNLSPARPTFITHCSTHFPINCSFWVVQLPCIWWRKESLKHTVATTVSVLFRGVPVLVFLQTYFLRKPKSWIYIVIWPSQNLPLVCSDSYMSLVNNYKLDFLLLHFRNEAMKARSVEWVINSSPTWPLALCSSSRVTLSLLAASYFQIVY